MIEYMDTLDESENYALEGFCEGWKKPLSAVQLKAVINNSTFKVLAIDTAEKKVVGRPEIQKFVGALDGQKARKGIFITTSSFTKEAIEYAKGTTVKVVLIDGDRLADLMIENNLGVSTVMSYVIKRVDSDYFDNEVSL